jgi:hypothetical protein
MNLSEKLKSYLPKLQEKFLHQPENGSFDFIRGRKTILRELQYCLRAKNLVGVYSNNLGKGMFLLGVEKIISEGDHHLIVFHSHDMSGVELQKRVIGLEEIELVVPFNNPYVNPEPELISRNILRMVQ